MSKVKRTCQKCNKEYWIDDDGMWSFSASYCMTCNPMVNLPMDRNTTIRIAQQRETLVRLSPSKELSLRASFAMHDRGYYTDKPESEKRTEYIEAFRQAPSGSREEREVFKSWLRSCRKPAEAKEAFYATSIEDFEEDAFDRWLELCSTTDEAKEAFYATNVSSREDSAFRQWLHLCHTVDEALEAYRSTNNTDREDWAKKKICELGGEI